MHPPTPSSGPKLALRRSYHKPIARWARRGALVTAALFAWSFGLSAPTQALAYQLSAMRQGDTKKPARSPSKLSSKPWLMHIARPSTTSPLRPYPASVTLLDELGRLRCAVSGKEVAAWKSESRKSSLRSQRAALVHIWLGEWELAANQEPEQAFVHFQRALHLTERKDRLHGLAAYDSAIALEFEGAYSQATDAFRKLLDPKTGLPGYDRAACALWYRHTAACAGYHAEREAMGIPEPTRLDPFCGAAALAAFLRANSLPFDRKHVLSACRVTGRGSSLKDLYVATNKLGLHAWPVRMDDAGLISMPKPAVLYVEHDHFISVLSANKSGVTYLCSDCGPWPGGKVSLNWKQWHALEPTGGMVLAIKGSDQEAVLSRLLDKKAEAAYSGIELAAQRVLPGLHLQNLAFQERLFSLLKGHLLLWPTFSPTCGYTPSSPQCQSYLMCSSDPPCGGGVSGGGKIPKAAG